MKNFLILSFVFLSSCGVLSQSSLFKKTDTMSKPLAQGDWHKVKDNPDIVYKYHTNENTYTYRYKNRKSDVSRLEIIHVPYEYTSLFWYINVSSPTADFNKIWIITQKKDYSLFVEDWEILSEIQSAVSVKNQVYQHNFYGQVNADRIQILNKVLNSSGGVKFKISSDLKTKILGENDLISLQAVLDYYYILKKNNK